ncbi:MAG: T9SS type A sorting domain-containing protein [Bacteroidetes bacterium]|jgi:hypothetical protein|nr:T9SS type A sorting domain-containing protein [Bacteroidota bacterium]
MKFTRTIIAAAVLSLPIGLVLLSNASGPSAAASGSPKEGGNNCTVCHMGTANSGGGSLSFSGIEGYTPGETYTITVNVNDETSSKRGFQATMLNSSNQPVGNLKPLSGNELFTSGGNNYVQHASPSSSGTFTFEWQAPSTVEGTVTLFAAGNASNGDGNPTGDKIYTNSLTISSSTSMDQELNPTQVSVYPNPSSGQVALHLPTPLDVRIVTLQGKEVFRSDGAVGDVLANGLLPGTYLVIARDDKGQGVQHLVVQ